MNEKPVMLGIPVVAALPQTAVTDVAAPFLQDSQAFQGILQAITEVKEEGTKPVGMQQVLASLLPTGSAVFPEGVSIEPPKPEEKKGERENANAMSVMATALVAPPVVFQAIDASAMGTDGETLNNLSVTDGGLTSNEAAFIEKSSLPIEAQNQKSGQTVPMSMIEPNAEIPESSSVTKDVLATEQTNLMQKGLPIADNNNLAAVQGETEAGSKMVTEGLKSFDSGSVPGKTMAVQTQTVVSGPEENLSEEPAIQRKAAVTASPSTETTQESIVNPTSDILSDQVQTVSDDNQSMGIMVESVTVPVTQEPSGNTVPFTVALAETASVSDQTAAGRSDLGFRAKETASDTQNILQSTDSGNYVPAGNFQMQPDILTVDFSSSTRDQDTPITITPLVSEKQANVSKEATETGVNIPVEQESPDMKAFGRTFSSKGSILMTEGREAQTIVDPLTTTSTKDNLVLEERVQSKPIDPATMMARQHERQLSTKETKGISHPAQREGGIHLTQTTEPKLIVKMPADIQKDLQPSVEPDVSSSIRFANLEETPLEKAAVPEKGKETTPVTEAKTSLPKPEVSVKEAVPVTPMGVSTGSTDVLPTSEPVTRTVKYEPREVVNQIVRGTHVMVRDGATQMQIRLDPPELGKVELKIVAEQDGIKAHFVTESQTVKALIETQLPHLRNALQQAGLQADTLSVSVGGRWTQGGNSGSAFSGRENQSFYTPNHRYTENAGEDIQYRESEAAASSWLGRINLKA